MRERAYPITVVLCLSIVACGLPGLTDVESYGSIEFTMTGVDTMSFVGKAAFSVSPPPNNRENEFWSMHVLETATATGLKVYVNSRGQTPGVGTYGMGVRQATGNFRFSLSQRTPERRDRYVTVSGEFVIERSSAHRIVGRFAAEVARYCRVQGEDREGSCDPFNPTPDDPRFDLVGTFNLPQVSHCCLEIELDERRR